MIFEVIIGWAFILTMYIIWMVRRKPFKRHLTYDFPMSGFKVLVKRW